MFNSCQFLYYMSLNTQTKKMSLVINIPNDKTSDYVLNNLRSYIKTACLEYYFILHDKDIKDESGQLKTKHIHLIVLLDKQCRLLTFLNRICKNVLKDEKYSNLISIQSVKDYDYAIAYLVHKNDKLKFQYSKDLVETNNNEYLDAVLSHDNHRELDIDYIIDLCTCNDNVLDVLKIIGLWNAKTYLNVITYIFNNTHKLPF